MLSKEVVRSQESGGASALVEGQPAFTATGVQESEQRWNYVQLVNEKVAKVPLLMGGTQA